MIKFKTILENHFNKIQCFTHSEITELVDKESCVHYKVKFEYIGVCVSDFDALAQGKIEGKGCRCFDVLSLSDNKIKYIELKSSMTKRNIQELGNKFYFGHIKTQAIIAPLQIKDCSYEYIVIYTRDVFSKEDDKPKEELQKKTKNYNKDHIKAWQNYEVFLEFENPEIDPFKGGMIPIQRHLYEDVAILLN